MVHPVTKHAKWYRLDIELCYFEAAIERVTAMTADELVAVLQDRDSSDGTATRLFLITWILFGRQITTV